MGEALTFGRWGPPHSLRRNYAQLPGTCSSVGNHRSPRKDHPMIISLSGGADSSTLLLYSLLHGQEEIQPVAFIYDQRHKVEINAARFLCQHYRIKYGPERLRPLINVRLQLPSTSALTNPGIAVPPLEKVLGHPQPPTYVPFRNAIFATHCMALAEAYKHDMISLGVHKSDTYGYWDTTAEFILSIENLANLNRQVRIKVWAPFLNWTKQDIIQWGLSQGVPYQYTWSCYDPKPVDVSGFKPCRVCATCVEREASFTKCGVKDPLEVMS